MSTLDDGWYIAEPDGTTFGPMTRGALHDAFVRRLHSAEALAWHVEHSEWRLLSSIAHTSGPAPDRSARESRPPPLQDEQARLTATLAKAAEAARHEVQQKRERKAKAKAAVAAPRERDLAAAPATAPTPAAGTTASNAPIALRRFAARILDTVTLGLLGAAVLWGLARWAAIRFGLGEVTDPPFPALLFLAPLALLPLETIALTIAGTTPGKALLGLEVRRRDGSRAGPFKLFARSAGAFARGMALGLLPVALFTTLVAGATYVNKGVTSWDERSGTQVRAEPLSAGRLQAAAIALVVAWFVLTSDQAHDALRELAQRVYVWMFSVVQ